jgi:pimeloyl-ACP methyl ester carboxylesterase
VSAIEQFRIAVPQEDLDDLRDRLERTRWPAESPATGWQRGVPMAYLCELVDYWLGSYDWRAWEARLNALPQFTTVIDRQRIHFVHLRSSEPDALPLVITHGWPGSFVELLAIIGPLTDPAAHGGDEVDAFDVIAPSPPGFAFSTPVAEPGWTHQRVARAWVELMRRLGYRRYGAHGGDTGFLVSPEIGRIAPDRVVGVHIYGGLEFDSITAADYPQRTDAERRRLTAVDWLRREATGYAAIQSTRPQTLGFALNDSPVAQLAWIVDKFHDWTDPAAVLPDQAVGRDHLLTNVTLYWLTGTGATSAHQYYENRVATAAPATRSEVPTGIAVFPTDPNVRRVAERQHTVMRWAEYGRGGHFAALEAPDLLVDDLRAFYRPLR